MFQALLILDDGKELVIRDEKYAGRMPMVLVWQTVDSQGQPLTRTFIHDPRKPPDGSGEYVPGYVETVSLNVTVET